MGDGRGVDFVGFVVVEEDWGLVVCVPVRVLILSNLHRRPSGAEAVESGGQKKRRGGFIVSVQFSSSGCFISRGLVVVTIVVSNPLLKLSTTTERGEGGGELLTFAYSKRTN